MSWYVFSLTLHLLAAMTWIGGMIFFGLVGAPAVRDVQDPAVRRALFNRMGRRFRAVGWGAVVLLLTTGALNLHLRGVLAAALVADPDFWGSPFGRALGIKLLLVAAMLAVAGVHDAWLGSGPRPC